MSQHILSLLVPFRGGVRVLIFFWFFLCRQENTKKVVLLSGGDGKDGPSGSVPNVVTQEDDVVWRAERRKQIVFLNSGDQIAIFFT